MKVKCKICNEEIIHSGSIEVFYVILGKHYDEHEEYNRIRKIVNDWYSKIGDEMNEKQKICLICDEPHYTWDKILDNDDQYENVFERFQVLCTKHQQLGVKLIKITIIKKRWWPFFK